MSVPPPPRRQPAVPGFGGAIDLAALAAAKANDEARTSSGIEAMTEANANDVVQESLDRPVFLLMVSAAAPQCADLTRRAAGILAGFGPAVRLATVDVDVEAGLAQVFQVQAVPAMLALIQGRPIPMFQGSPEDAQLRQVIDQVLDIARQAGMTVGEADDALAQEIPLSPLHQEAYDAIERDDLDAALAAYDKALKENPKDADAKAGKAQVALMKRTGDADAASAIAGAQAGDAQAALVLADLELMAGQAQAACERVLEVLAGAEGDLKDAARLRLLEYFELLGASDPVVVSARKALASLLN